MWGWNHSSLKTGHYRGRRGGGWSWGGGGRRRKSRFLATLGMRVHRRCGRLWGLRLWRGGGGRDEVVVVVVDGIVDGVAPAVGAEGFDVFVLGEADGLEERLRQVGDGAGGFGFYVAADDGGEDAGEGRAEIAGGEVVAGEEVGQVLADVFGGAGAGFFLGVVEAEVGMVAEARDAATAAIGEGEQTQGCAVVLTDGRRAADFTA